MKVVLNKTIIVNLWDSIQDTMGKVSHYVMVCVKMKEIISNENGLS